MEGVVFFFLWGRGSEEVQVSGSQPGAVIILQVESLAVGEDSRVAVGPSYA